MKESDASLSGEVMMLLQSWTNSADSWSFAIEQLSPTHTIDCTLLGDGPSYLSHIQEPRERRALQTPPPLLKTSRLVILQFKSSPLGSDPKGPRSSHMHAHSLSHHGSSS